MDAADAIHDKSLATLMLVLLRVLHSESPSIVIAMRDVLEHAVKDATANNASAEEVAIISQAWGLVNAITLAGPRSN